MARLNKKVKSIVGGSTPINRGRKVTAMKAAKRKKRVRIKKETN